MANRPTYSRVPGSKPLPRGQRLEITQAFAHGSASLVNPAAAGTLPTGLKTTAGAGLTGAQGAPGIPGTPGAPGSPGLLILNYVAAADLASAASLTAATWTDLCADQAFTVLGTGARVDFSMMGSALISAATLTGISARLLLDDTTAVLIAGGSTGSAGGQANVLSGSGIEPISGLAQGAHTVKVQVYSEAAATVYCRPATKPNTEFLKIRGYEIN